MYHHSARGRKPMRCTRGACATGIFGLVCLLLPAPYLLPRLLACRLPPTQEAPTVPYFHAPAPLFPQATHLIMVAGHAVLTASTRTSTTVTDEKSWYLEPFQHGHGAMLAHISVGSSWPRRTMTRCSSSLVATRAAARAPGVVLGRRPRPWIGMATRTCDRAPSSGECARLARCSLRSADSARPCPYPTRVTVVSLASAHRTELHRHALRYRDLVLVPASTRPTSASTSCAASCSIRQPSSRTRRRAESRSGVLPRASRNPFRRREGYRDSCPELQGLLAYCGRARYAGALPWSSEVGDDEDERRRTVP